MYKKIFWEKFEEFITALNFLTIIKVKPDFIPHETTLGKSMALFPIIGLLIGTILIIINWGSGLIFSKQFSSIAIIISVVIITGGLHLDAFADTIDGFSGGKNKDEILQIMRDSRIGSLGVVGLICLLLSKYVLLQNMEPRFLIGTLLTLPMISRWIMVSSAVFYPSAREEGLGKAFISNVRLQEWYIATGITIITAMFALSLWRAVVVSAIIFTVNVYLGKWCVKKINGMTGDTIGASSEVSELLFLMTMSMFK